MTELGNKHECLECGTKFYDLGRNELICPNCGADQKVLAETQDSSSGKATTTKKKAKKKAKAKKSAKKAKAEEPEAEAAEAKK